MFLDPASRCARTRIVRRDQGDTDLRAARKEARTFSMMRESVKQRSVGASFGAGFPIEDGEAIDLYDAVGGRIFHELILSLGLGND